MTELYLIAGAIYATGAALGYRHRTRAMPHIRPLLYACALIGLGLHLLPILQEAATSRDVAFGVTTALGLFVSIAVVVELTGFRYGLRDVQILLLIFAAIASLASLATVARPATLDTQSVWLLLHFFLANIAYSISFVVLLHVIFLYRLERQIRRLQFTASDAPPPVHDDDGDDTPLLSRERDCFRGVWWSFIFIMLTLVTGFFKSYEKSGVIWSLTHKNLFALLTAVVLCVLLVGRHFYGWRRRRAQVLLLSGIGFLLLSYLGSHFVLQVILQR